MLSDDKKRADYDNPLPPPPTQSNFSRSGQTGYQWKNPEFDPNFNHFQEFKQSNYKQSNNGQQFEIPVFKSFNNFNTFKPFANFSFEFGAFTFEMAEEIFRNVFT